MLFGNPLTFAIECFHDPYPNDRRWVFGRMAILVNGGHLGDISEGGCMLNVSVGQLEDALRNIDYIDEPEFHDMADAELFDRLACVLYGDDEFSITQIVENSTKYRKFNFLTNGGESFDPSKSFLVAHGDQLRLLFDDHTEAVFSARFPRAEFEQVVKGFLAWVEHEAATLDT